ncbi:hypothetical protein PM082_016626 [Marasmius tenuissimus]|nr:hypothetical protein PM082_016626 [Marasmius tenuissimus]
MFGLHNPFKVIRRMKQGHHKWLFCEIPWRIFARMWSGVSSWCIAMIMRGYSKMALPLSKKPDFAGFYAAEVLGCLATK